MKKWIIAYNGNRCEPEVFSAAVKQDNPNIIFLLNGVKFNVTFVNQSDYMASSEGTEADIQVTSITKSKTFTGTAICVLDSKPI
jgi:hypothetical protein